MFHVDALNPFWSGCILLYIKKKKILWSVALTLSVLWKHPTFGLGLLGHIHFASLRGGLRYKVDYSRAGWKPRSAGKGPSAAGDSHGRARPLEGAGIVPRHWEKALPAPSTQNEWQAARKAKGTRFKNSFPQYLQPRDVKESLWYSVCVYTSVCTILCPQYQWNIK